MEDPENLPSEDFKPDETEIEVEDIFACLEGFDETHRTAFLLKYREGLSIEEISAVLDLPKGTVKSRLFYTREKIRKKLRHRISHESRNQGEA